MTYFAYQSDNRVVAASTTEQADTSTITWIEPESTPDGESLSTPKIHDDGAIRNATQNEIDAWDLADAMAAKKLAINAKTTQLLTAGFAYDSKTFGLDTDSKTSWIALFNLRASLSYPFVVSDIDGMSYSLSNSDAVEAFAAAAFTAGESIISSGRSLIEQVSQGTTVGEVAAIEDNR